MKRRYFHPTAILAICESNNPYEVVEKVAKFAMNVEKEVKKIDYLVGKGKKDITPASPSKFVKPLLVSTDVSYAFLRQNASLGLSNIHNENLKRLCVRLAGLVNKYGTNMETYEEEKQEIQQLLTEIEQELTSLSNIHSQMPISEEPNQGPIGPGNF